MLTPPPSGKTFRNALGRCLLHGRDLMSNGVFTQPGTGRKYYSAYPGEILYDWDSYFEVIAQLYFGWDIECAVSSFEMLLEGQDPQTGFAPRLWMTEAGGPEYELGRAEHAKPFFAQTACLIASYLGSIDWLAGLTFERMSRHLEYWLTVRDTAGIGLSVWDSGPHSGMDTQHERTGHWKDCLCAGVDINCYLVRECHALAELARLLGDSDAAEVWDLRGDDLAGRIREKLWDEDDGLFHDLDTRTGERIPVRSVAAFASLWAGVATSEQARRMVVGHLLNPVEFWRRYPIPALAATEPGYCEESLPGDVGCNWRGCTWMLSNYFVCQGLRRYGYNELASILAERSVELIERAGSREWYTSDTGRGQGQGEFRGFSVTALFLPLEEEVGFDPTKIPADRNGWASVSALLHELICQSALQV